MKIEEIEVAGLFNMSDKLSLKFHEDLNIITGKNGSGKTTLLKLLWYVISGNIGQALREVEFRSISVSTDVYICTIHRLSRLTCRIELSLRGETFEFEDLKSDDGDTIVDAEDQANSVLVDEGTYVFFPTFRRIEGGFSISARTGSGIATGLARSRNEIEEGLTSLARKLSHEGHVFVSSISTVDIVGLLLRQYADLSEKANKLQSDTGKEIIQVIKDYRLEEYEQEHVNELEGRTSSDDVIDLIRVKVESMEKQRTEALAPIDAVRELVERLFRHSGIKFGPRLSFGDAATAISSDQLSAGEKQLLSFICYNAFYRDSIFFIDEPELSLHVDWQRQLFPTMLSQHRTNQFIIATHSPFIYGKYSDKELLLDVNRGDEGADI